MNYLKWLKMHGRALVIRGPEGCGKTLLAKQLTENNYLIISEKELTIYFNGYLKAENLIIDSIDPTPTTMNTIERMVKNDRMMLNQRGKEGVIVPTPFIIVCVDSRYDYFFPNRRRFEVIDLGVAK